MVPNEKAGEQTVPEGSPPENQSFPLQISGHPGSGMFWVPVCGSTCSCLQEIHLGALLDKQCWKNDSERELAHRGLRVRSQEHHLCASRRTGLCRIPTICSQLNKE